MDGVYSYCVGLLHIAASDRNIRKSSEANHVLDLRTFALSLVWASTVGICQHTTPCRRQSGAIEIETIACYQRLRSTYPTGVLDVVKYEYQLQGYVIRRRYVLLNSRVCFCSGQNSK